MIPKIIIDLVSEATSLHSDGYCKSEAIAALSETKRYIDAVLAKITMA